MQKHMLAAFELCYVIKHNLFATKKKLSQLNISPSAQRHGNHLAYIIRILAGFFAKKIKVVIFSEHYVINALLLRLFVRLSV